MTSHILLKRNISSNGEPSSISQMRSSYWIQRIENAEDFDELFTVICSVHKESFSLSPKHLDKLYLAFNGKFEALKDENMWTQGLVAV